MILVILDNLNKNIILQDHSLKPMIKCYSGHKFCRESTIFCNNSLPELQMQCRVMKTLAVHSHSDDCSTARGRSAGCRTSCVCLQYHASVVTPNAITICGSKFPPTVNKHCEQQHSSIPKTVPAMWNSNNPSCCDIQDGASSV